MVALALALAAGCGAPPPPPPGPGVVLVVVDSLRRDHVSSYGYPRATTPRLDRLAAQGVRYDRAVAQAPWTTPSVASLLTSRYPSEVGIRDVRALLADEHVLLPEVLQEHGYATGAVVSHAFCSSEWNFDQGFDTFDETWVQGHQAITSAGITDAGIRFLQGHGTGPFFLFLHYFDPHHAYQLHPEAPWARPDGSRFSQEYAGPLRPGLTMREMARLIPELGPADVGELHRYYDSEIRHTDAQLGRLLDHLDATGLAERTLVVVTSDHGEEFLDHGALGHTKTLYRELVEVPLVVRYPAGAGPSGGVSEAPVELVDLFPTALEVAGIPRPAGLAGQSLLTPAPADRPLFSETSRLRDLRAVAVGGRKLVRDLETGAAEVYDLVADPGEASPGPEVPADLDAVLAGWLRPAAAAPRKVITPAERALLAELGYVVDP